MKSKPIKKSLICILTDKERREYGITLATTLGDMEAVEAQKKTEMDNYKNRLAGMQAKVDELSSKVRNGKEWRDVDCQVLYGVPDKEHKQTIRLDTGETVATEIMSETDLQLVMPLGDDSPGVSTLFDAPDDEENLMIGGDDDEDDEDVRDELTKHVGLVTEALLGREKHPLKRKTLVRVLRDKFGATGMQMLLDELLDANANFETITMVQDIRDEEPDSASGGGDSMHEQLARVLTVLIKEKKETNRRLLLDEVLEKFGDSGIIALRKLAYDDHRMTKEKKLAELISEYAREADPSGDY